MRHHRNSENVNAGSMADIAFLLLIFFLVTTTISTDAGINRNLPAFCPTNDCATLTADNNVLRIVLNNSNDILMNNKLVPLNAISQQVSNFVNNNGDNSCSYCSGEQLLTASDNPQKAIISLEHNRQTSYELFIQVQNSISKAITDLREVYSQNNFRKSLSDLSSTEIEEVRKAYPLIISEVETN
ncbi:MULTISPECIES: ExbD/TolR family protein [Bizionia]|uniref:ExbD/TolR family protein n=1 Tax=Bizionia hallyeonensis TaxID=1123757 RepID=A0ABW0C4P5_9FLAO|nr:biopolymer transporter ExbD [Bizionia sp. M204]UPS91103.1 biopolymer transporter ExbD [Bizionia sp. M204]